MRPSYILNILKICMQINCDIFFTSALIRFENTYLQKGRRWLCTNLTHLKFTISIDPLICNNGFIPSHSPQNRFLLILLKELTEWITFYDKQAQRWNRENTLEVNENNVIFSKRMNIRSTNEVFKLTYAINLCTFLKKKIYK